MVQLALCNATPLERWRNEVSIMLEKVARNINVAKLRAILLLEADLNALNKIIFNGRAIPRIETSKTIPYEVIGRRRRQSSLHVALNKKLVCNIEN